MKLTNTKSAYIQNTKKKKEDNQLKYFIKNLLKIQI